jgi:hypothetical protein
MVDAVIRPEEKSEPNMRGLLLLAAVITLVAWQFELRQQLLYPFTLLATYAHEMGHGLTALLIGADFDYLQMNLDGSGLAQWHGQDVGRLGRALISAGGLVGPSIAGSILLVLSKRATRARPILYVLSILMLTSAVLVARSAFAFVFIIALAAVFALVAHFARSLAPFFVQLIGVQLCLAVFRDVSYMFSEGALVGGVQRVSDSGAIADALLLPYWFWGALTAAFSFAVLALGLYVALSGAKRVEKRAAARV